jgi:hypothetical protein
LIKRVLLRQQAKGKRNLRSKKRESTPIDQNKLSSAVSIWPKFSRTAWGENESPWANVGKAAQLIWDRCYGF